MRKKTAQPTRKHPTTSSSQPSGLIVNELKPGRSDGEKSAIDDRSHLTGVVELIRETISNWCCWIRC